MPFLRAEAGPVDGDDGDAAAGVDVGYGGIGDVHGDVVGQSQDLLLLPESHLERIPIHHGFWPFLYLKCVLPRRDGLHRRLGVAGAGEPFDAIAEAAGLTRQFPPSPDVCFEFDYVYLVDMVVSGIR